MKLLHAREARIVEGTLREDDEAAMHLVIDGKRYGVLEASEAGLTLIEATDEERFALVDAGYPLPSHVAASEGS